MSQSPNATPTIQVLVATPSATTGQGGIDRVMATLKMQLEREGRSNVSVRFLPSRGSGHVALSIFYAIGFCLRMLVARLRGKVDVLHINLSGFGSTYRKMVIAKFAHVLGIPYVLHLHGAEYQSFWKAGEGRLSRMIRDMFEHAAQVVVLGRIWRDFISLRAPGAADKIVIIPNATAVPKLAHQGGGDMVHILFLGRIGDRKGVPQLGEALYRMRDIPGWRATIAGDGAVDAARTKVVELGMVERIALPGWVAPDTVAELIASADILVLPSFAENLPVSVIEGMAAGLAVVTTPVGAVQDIIVNGETGLLVEAGDVDALAAAMTRLICDPALRGRLGRNAIAVHRQRLDLAPFSQAICEVWFASAKRP